MKGKRTCKERILAFMLTFAMVVGMVMEPVQLQAAAVEGEPVQEEIVTEPSVPEEEPPVEENSGISLFSAEGSETDVTETGTGDGTDTGEGEDGTGETTEPGEEPTESGGDEGETVEYTIEITAPNRPFYPGEKCEEGFSATIRDQSGTNVEGTVSWSCPENQGYFDGNYLFVNDDVTAGTNIEVTAEFEDATNTVGVTVEDRPIYTIEGYVFDSYNYDVARTALQDAEIQIKKITEAGSDNIKSVKTDEYGKYSIPDIKGGSGITYEITAAMNDFESETIYIDMGTISGIGGIASVGEIQLTTNKTFTISADKSSVYVGDEVTLGIQDCPEEWSNDVQWTVDTEIFEILSQSGNNILLKAKAVTNDADDGAIEATVHGKKCEPSMKISVNQIGISVSNILISDLNNPGEPVKAKGAAEVSAHLTFDSEIPETVNIEYKFYETADQTQTEIKGGSGTISSDENGDVKIETGSIFKFATSYTVVLKVSNPDNRYNSEEVSQEFVVSSLPGQTITFTNPVTEYIYGDMNKQVHFKAKVQDGNRAENSDNWKVSSMGLEGGQLSDLKVDTTIVRELEEDFVEVEGTVSFNARAAGAVQLSLSYSHTDDKSQIVYTDARADLALQINQKKIGIENITFEEKVYDGTADVEIKSIILTENDKVIWTNDKGEPQVDDVYATLKEGSLTAVNADEVATLGKETINNLENAVSNPNYYIDTTNVGNFECEIKPRKLYLKVTEATREYGKSGVYKGNGPKVELAAEEDLVQAGILENVSWEDVKPLDGEKAPQINEINVKDLTADKEVVSQQGNPYKELKPEIDNGFLIKGEEGHLNYEYVETTKLYGDLTITPKKGIDLRDYLDFIGNSNITYDPDKQANEIWVRGNVEASDNYAVTINLLYPKDAPEFDAIKIENADENSDNIEISEANPNDGSSSAITVKFLADKDTAIKPVNLTFGLYTKDGDSNNYVLCSEKTLSFTFKVDTKAPIVKFDESVEAGNSDLSSLVSTITFNRFQPVAYSMSVTSEEKEETEGSGVKKDESENYLEYLILEINADTQKEELQTLVDNCSDPWTQVKDGKILLSTEQEQGLKEGHYIVAVASYDNVGNTKVYTSNGIVLENNQPDILFDTNEIKDYYNLQDMENHEFSLKGIEVVDKKGSETSSGIKKVSYLVYKGGNAFSDLKDVETLIPDGKETILYSSVKDEYKWSELQENTAYTKQNFTVNFAINDKFNGNDVYLRVIAVDNAGNSYENTVNLRFDLTRPTIDITYSNVGNTAVHNDNYFNGNRVMKIQVSDRNLNMNDTKLILSLKDKNLNKQEIVLDGRSSTLEYLNSLTDIYGEKIFSNIDFQIDNGTGKDENIHQSTVTLEFNGNEQYTVDFSTVDMAGNTNGGKDFDGNTVENRNITYHDNAAGDAAYTTFTIDKVNPVIKQIYSANGVEVSMLNGEVYNQNKITYDVYISEHNFRSDNLPFEANSETTISRSPDQNEVLWNPDSEMEARENWQENGNLNNTEQWKYTFTFEAQGAYRHFFEYKDLAGNPAIYVDSNGNEISNTDALFTIDCTQGTGSVSINGFGFWETFLHNITFGLFNPSSVDVEMNAEDYTSPLYAVQYFRTPDPMSLEQLENYDWSNTNYMDPSEDGYKAHGAFTVNPDEQFVVYMKVTDYANNVSYFSSDGMIVDSTKPAPVVTITNLSQSQNGIFNEDVTLQIDVEDPYAGDTYSGLERVWYTVSASGNVNTSETIELLNNSSSRVQSNQTFSQVITVPANVYNSNDVKVQAFAVDFSGNQGESEVTEMKIDVTNPTISVSWDLNNPLNGSYYKDTRTATVTVTDRNFDPNNVRFSITNTDGTEANIGGWSSSSDIGVSDNATSTCQVAFPADGDYTFTLGCTDLAGNSTEYGQTDEFTIDKTVPEISVSYNNNSARNGNYYNEVRTATVTVREHNFNAADVKAAITASLEGRGISAPSISGFSGSGDVHTATVTYGTDGDYTFDVEYTDMAGNAAADYTPDDFTVDLTEPEIEITDVADKSANNDVVSPSVKATDVNYDSRNVTITITGAKNGKVNIGNVVSAIQNGQTVKFNDFAREDKMDDLYTLTAKAIDMAGNEKEESIIFSVNRYGSVYVLDTDTAEWLDVFTPDENGEDKTYEYTYINQEREIGVTEYNVDTIEQTQITVNRDGNIENLKEKTDYEVTSSGTEAQWKANHYVLKADNFATEGNYSVIFSTQDKAGNTMNNTSVKKNENLPIDFSVDKTAPTVVISGVEDGGSYRSAEQTMTVDAKDNLALHEVVVSVDGTDTIYETDILAESNGVIDMPIASANNFQQIEVTASDKAGNIQKMISNGDEQKESLSVLVTPNIMVQYYMNKPLFYGSIIGIVAVAGLIIFLVVWKRRKNEGKR